MTLCSSPVPDFQWGTKTYGPDMCPRAFRFVSRTCRTMTRDAKCREFWTKMNNELDQYSVKKWIADELITLHKQRGDKICFVTKRIYTGSEKLTDMLTSTFQLPERPTVAFTNRESKMDAFRKLGAVISYGDSDGDIRESIQAGARPIRILRAPNSVNHDPTHNGHSANRSWRTPSSISSSLPDHPPTPSRPICAPTTSASGLRPKT